MRLLMLILITLPLPLCAQTGYQETTTYQYDNLNRLTQVDFSDGTIYNYVYDNLGNRIQINVTEVSNPISLNEAWLENGITMYPNPTTGNLTIELPEMTGLEKVNARIIDITGKTVFEQSTIPQNFKINLGLSSLQAGTYLLKLTSNDQHWLELFIKE